MAILQKLENFVHTIGRRHHRHRPRPILFHHRLLLPALQHWLLQLVLSMFLD
jgi:hypothetical protein